MINLNEFIWKWNGKACDYDGNKKFWCVDAVRQYIKDVKGWDAFAVLPAGPTAISIFNNFKDNQYYRKVINTKYNIPKKGDILFFKFYPFLYGSEGHTCIYCDGDLFTIISFDQNWPTGSLCHLQRHGTSKLFHGYRGCVGWLTPQK